MKFFQIHKKDNSTISMDNKVLKMEVLQEELALEVFLISLAAVVENKLGQEKVNQNLLNYK
jgi:hypothetical protein